MPKKAKDMTMFLGSQSAVVNPGLLHITAHRDHCPLKSIWIDGKDASRRENINDFLLFSGWKLQIKVASLPHDNK